MTPKLLRQFDVKDPVIFMIVALLCAAALVVYLQQRAIRALDRQTTLIVEKVAEQTASEVLQNIRRTFDGPVFDTLASIKHPYLVEHRLDLVAPRFESGLEDYPHIDRFFIWLDAPPESDSDEVLFLSRKQPAPTVSDRQHRFNRDPVTAHLITETARQHAKEQMIYGAFRTRTAAGESDIFLRIFYTDAARTRFFAVLGFVVNLESIRRDLFPVLAERGLNDLLKSSPGGLAFDLSIHDEHGQLVYGSGNAGTGVSLARSVPLVFYPLENILPLMAAGVPPRPWRLTVTQLQTSAPGFGTQTKWQRYGLSGLSVMLICVALAFALQARARANQLSRMQSDFVAHVSHQLKTPVSLLSAVAETLDVVRTRSPEKLGQCLDIMKMETSRLSLLVQHILEFSSLTDGARRFEPEPVLLGPLVRETAESFAAALGPTGFRIEVHEYAEPVVAADPVALEQAIVNLLDNAIKYSDTSRLVTVRLRADAAHAIIEVEDRGVGIAPADQARIFDRFYRAPGTTARPQGFGLGLAIARQLVAGQRGRIELESSLGEGSTFRIRLPLLRGVDARTGAGSPRWLAAQTAAPVDRRTRTETSS